MSACEDFFEQRRALEVENPRLRGKRGDALRYVELEASPGGESPRQFAEREQRNAQRKAELQARLLAWESERASPFGPGPVDSTEKLRRAIFSSHLVDGKLTDMAFHELLDLGFSMDRCAGCEDSTLASSKARADSIAATRGVTAVGYIEMPAQYLRDYRHNKVDGQVVGIYGTGNPENHAHVDAFVINKPQKRVPIDDLKGELADAFRDSIQPWPKA